MSWDNTLPIRTVDDIKEGMNIRVNLVGNAHQKVDGCACQEVNLEPDPCELHASRVTVTDLEGNCLGHLQWKHADKIYPLLQQGMQCEAHLLEDTNDGFSRLQVCFFDPAW